MKPIAFVIMFLFAPHYALASEIKLSKSGICHDVNSSWYNRTKNYEPFQSMRDCFLKGRPYSGYTPYVDNEVNHELKITSDVEIEYDRSLYGGWIDEDSDCQNTRHEILASLSTSRVVWNDSGCSVIRGRWLDPYTNKVFTEARELDIDHIVPLAYAHSRGGSSWTRDKRIKFGNDPRNLFAVEASENRRKGAQGPAEWLPSYDRFRCQYILRFDRIMKLYGLNYGEIEGAVINRTRERVC